MASDRLIDWLTLALTVPCLPSYRYQFYLKIKCLNNSKFIGYGSYLLNIGCMTKSWLITSLQVFYVAAIKDTLWFRTTNGQWRRNFYRICSETSKCFALVWWRSLQQIELCRLYATLLDVMRITHRKHIERKINKTK